ncbi:MAG TPA: thioesterase family protein [Anaeromyxobacteraceae bacterium]|nr:thioesterase family protein [Anaeromyxobacteraceae bacterium]
MTAPFTRRFRVRWSDADANGHLRNTAYAEYANDTRVGLFASLGFDWPRFQSLRLGPVLFREEIEYRREAGMGEEVLVDALAAGLAPDASRWSIRHRLWRVDGTEMAQITVVGSWIDLEARRATAPPQDLAEALRGLPRTAPFLELPAIRRR